MFRICEWSQSKMYRKGCCSFCSSGLTRYIIATSGCGTMVPKHLKELLFGHQVPPLACFGPENWRKYYMKKNAKPVAANPGLVALTKMLKAGPGIMVPLNWNPPSSQVGNCWVDEPYIFVFLGRIGHSSSTLFSMFGRLTSRIWVESEMIFFEPVTGFFQGNIPQHLVAK